MKKILVTGANGQLGEALRSTLPAQVDVVLANRATLDITDSNSVSTFFAEHEPQGVINAAAYTAVDQAEDEPQIAAAVNTKGVEHLATACREYSAHLVHVSTDFVFDGSKGAPYKPSDETNPLSVYGKTKDAGERIALGTDGLSATVLRTAWVYGGQDSNFLSTMLRLMRERSLIAVVADQIGTPTLVSGLADACWGAMLRELQGVHHWTDAGAASWYDFACAILEESRACGLIANRPKIDPIPSSRFPTKAVRPANSQLDKFATWEALETNPQHWRHQLRAHLNLVSGSGQSAIEPRRSLADA